MVEAGTGLVDIPHLSHTQAPERQMVSETRRRSVLIEVFVDTRRLAIAKRGI